MPLSRRVGSKVPSVPFTTGVVAEARVVKADSPARRYSSDQMARVALLAVPTTSVGAVRVAPSARPLRPPVGGGPLGVGVMVGVAVAVRVAVAVTVAVGVLVAVRVRVDVAVAVGVGVPVGVALGVA